MLESPFFLILSFFCTCSTPVAGMLAHLPLPPFIIDYLDLYDDTFTDDELGIILVLWHCDHVRIRLILLFQCCRCSL